MDLALALLLLWGLLFVPLGIVLHWFVLGEGARVRALPLAPVTGIAIAFVVLAALGRAGIDAGEAYVAVAFGVVSIACIVAIWRLDITWRSGELVGAGALLLFTVFLLQLPVIGERGDGPLGYGTVVDPVAEVAAIEVAAGGPSAGLAISRAARNDADERPIGFEQFAALTVGIGQDEDPTTSRDDAWTAYTLHAPITAMLAALIALPLFAFAKARGVRWFGLIVLVPLGALAPAVFLALSNGEGAAISSVAFTTAGVFSLLVTRRDRGWWALVVLAGAAVAVTAGPAALLPLVIIGAAWMALRSDTYEHLSQHDAPVPPARFWAVIAASVLLGAYASLHLLLDGGELLAWSPLHDTMAGAVRSWPFAWLDSDLSTAGPRGGLETAIWLIGPALLTVAVIYAIVRNERRELGVLVGAIVAAAIAAALGLADEAAGVRLFEFVMLSVSPFLAALAIRAVALSRENAEEYRGTRQARIAGLGPTLLVIVFVVLSFASTAVTGTRMVHAPSDIATAGLAIGASGVAPAPGEQPKQVSTLIAAGDPWLQFAVDGERVEGGYADADAVSESRNGRSKFGTRTEGEYDELIVSSSPLSSDPAPHWIEQSRLDAYQVRLFVNSRTQDVDPDQFVDTARLDQRARAAVADRPGANTTSEGGTDSDVEAVEGAAADANADDGAAADQVVDVAAAYEPAERDNATEHTPVELSVALAAGDDDVQVPRIPADRPAGLLLPVGDIVGCGTVREVQTRITCEPGEPLTDGTDCTAKEVAAARSPIDRKKGSPRSSAPPQLLILDPDLNLSRRPPLIGVQCFDVPFGRDSSVLLVHLRDIGLVLPPEQALKQPAGAWDTERDASRIGSEGGRGVNGGTRLTSSELDSSLTFGGERLVGQGLTWDLVLEGDFGAGVSITSEQAPLDANNEPIDTGFAPLEIGRFRGSANGFSQLLRNVQLTGGSVSVANDTGTDVSLGRMFARPRDMPRSCDVPIALASGEQREIRLDVRDSDGGRAPNRPGLTVSIASVRPSDDGQRIARVVVGTYLSKSGLPRYTLVDWTEQFEGPVEVEGCDGTTVREEGAAPLATDEQVTATENAGAFGAADGAGGA
jgi:hypothetical protein